VEVTWVAGKCSIRQRALVCSGVDKGVKQNARDRNKVVYSVPLTDG